ncbi:MAG: hypothetical protein UR68_C0025G0011 [Candidatus Roizmanbacteria bacterium GW2011_GWA2_35_19]|uniref:Uncharacterized protein n=2 Tax=Candidatus Roizmaniibacteriota TaxID=1752723 RepID=A0A0G0C6V5_9BACT|nr:MAG: hypothetical protein UR63_C0032G0002 [Candidatus Roizmanbacteria bacterium GW2011_GWC2_35_12]KKP71866.1 MAG: hypothetical protein UR68_C0025G0011 [Candidatus Roizmanbacteria bacterium GW2011_GWA2_35_19]
MPLEIKKERITVDLRLFNELKTHLSYYGPEQLSQNDREYTRKFLHDFINTRNSRAQTVSSEEYDRYIREEVETMFPYPTFGLDCIDGRVLPVLLGGYAAKFGGFLRLPAGDPVKDFISLRGGDLALKSGSNYANRIDEAFLRRNTDHIAQILDSHVGCAAREKAEKKAGHKPNDKGLLVDVLRKKAMGEAIKNYVSINDGSNNKREILPVQVTFDTDNGFMYMGLEADDAIEAAIAAKGFTPDVLKKLSQSWKILSTKEMLSDEVKETLKGYAFKPDWENNYIGTLSQFWENIKRLKNSYIFDIIKTRLKITYSHLDKEINGNGREIEERAMILLANMYSGFLLNYRTREIKVKKGEKILIARPYPYSKHQEECIVASEGGYGPYKVKSFGVHILDEKSLPENIALAYNIIQNNRNGYTDDAGREHAPTINNYFGIYGPENDLFKRKTKKDKVPVPLIMQHTVRTGEFFFYEDKYWERLKDLNFSFILRMKEKEKVDWVYMEDADFIKKTIKYLNIKPDDTIGLAIAKDVNILRRKVAALYKYYIFDEKGEKVYPLANKLINGDITLLPVLADQNREIHKIIPFLANGS